MKIYNEEIEKRSRAYTQRTGQKLQKSTLTHLSAVVNLNETHTEEDLKKVCEYLERTLDTKIIQSAIHRDEGHMVDTEYESDDSKKNPLTHIEEFKMIKNYHAHIEFIGLDSLGASVKKKIKKGYLRTLQTEVAKILKMQRGDPNKKSIRLPTYAFKEHKRRETETIKKIELENRKSKQKKLEELKEVKIAKDELKEEVARARAILQENKAIRADYARLEQVNKDLLNRIESQNVDIEGHISYVLALEYQVNELDDIILSNQLKDIPPFDKELYTKKSMIEKKLIIPIKYRYCDENGDENDLYILRYTKGEGTTILMNDKVTNIPRGDIFLDNDTNKHNTKKLNIKSYDEEGNINFQQIFYFDSIYTRLRADEFFHTETQIVVQTEEVLMQTEEPKSKKIRRMM